LAKLGLAEEILIDAALTGQRYAADCTDLDAPNAAGFIRWAKTIRPLREQLVLKGWMPTNDRGFPAIVHPSRQHAVSCAGGDSFTGRPDRTPGTRSAKGPVIRDAIEVNVQRSFRDLDASYEWPVLQVHEAPLWRTWLLLVYWDEDEAELRLELSLPAQLDRDGYVVEWSERIILSAVPTHPIAGADYTAAGDLINVEVDVRDDLTG